MQIFLTLTTAQITCVMQTRKRRI